MSTFWKLISVATVALVAAVGGGVAPAAAAVSSAAAGTAPTGNASSWLESLQARSDALNRYYGLGNYASRESARTSISRCCWTAGLAHLRESRTIDRNDRAHFQTASPSRSRTDDLFSRNDQAKFQMLANAIEANTAALTARVGRDAPAKSQTTGDIINQQQRYTTAVEARRAGRAERDLTWPTVGWSIGAASDGCRPQPGSRPKTRSATRNVGSSADVGRRAASYRR